MGMAPYIMPALGIIVWIFSQKRGRNFRPTLLEVLKILAKVSLKKTRKCFAVSSLIASHFISHFASLVT